MLDKEEIFFSSMLLMRAFFSLVRLVIWFLVWVRIVLVVVIRVVSFRKVKMVVLSVKVVFY